MPRLLSKYWLALGGLLIAISVLALACVIFFTQNGKYDSSEIYILSSSISEDGTMVLKFQTKAETSYYCPSVNVLRDSNVELTFNRRSTFFASNSALSVDSIEISNYSGEAVYVIGRWGKRRLIRSKQPASSNGIKAQ